MEVNLKVILPTVIAMAALTACSSVGDNNKVKPQAESQAPAKTQTQAAPTTNQPTPQVVLASEIDGRKEVAYKCGESGQNALTVMYGFKDDNVVVAQVKYQNKLSEGLFRVINDGNTDRNIFVNKGIIWYTSAANAANIDKVDGGALILQGVKTVNNQEQVVTQVVTKDCKLDKVATEKLAKSAK